MTMFVHIADSRDAPMNSDVELMRRRSVAAATLLILCQTTFASPPVSIRLRELYEAATIVGAFEVLEGKMVSPGGQWCGARYKARVVDGIKNAVRGSVIEIGYVPYLKIGATYLLMLGELELPPSLVQSGDEFLKSCRPMLPAATIQGLWRGAMEIDGDTREPSKRETWLVRPVGHVEYPTGTRTNGLSGENRRVRYTDLLKRLAEK